MGEPPRSQGDLNFRLLGIPVRVHPFFWLFVAILGGHFPDLRSLLVWIAAAFVSVLSHELGHALVMRAAGRRPWITLYGFGGVTSFDRGWQFSGRDVSPLGQVTISAAGPAVGFLMTAAICGAAYLAQKIVVWYWPLAWVPAPAVLIRSSPTAMQFLNNLLLVNMVWGVFNLLPVYPLDGGQILRELLSLVHPRAGIQWSMIASVVVAGALAGYSLYQLGKAVGAAKANLDLSLLLGSSDLFMLLLFGALAYMNFQAYQAYTGRRHWR